VEGQPSERRAPEKADDKPEFPEQTRAPYHASAPYKVTTLIDNLPAPWSLAFLPGGKILLTERLPGRMRILDAKGVLSAPVAVSPGWPIPHRRILGFSMLFSIRNTPSIIESSSASSITSMAPTAIRG
jgi:hypothetical protein